MRSRKKYEVRRQVRDKVVICFPIPCVVLWKRARITLNPLQIAAKENVSYCGETGQTRSSASRSTNSPGRNPRRRASGAVQTWVRTALRPLIPWRVSAAAAAAVVLVWTRRHLRLSGVFKNDLLIVNRYYTNTLLVWVIKWNNFTCGLSKLRLFSSPENASEIIS